MFGRRMEPRVDAIELLEERRGQPQLVGGRDSATRVEI